MNNNQQRQWNSTDPATSFREYAVFLHETAKNMFLQDGTHAEIVFLIAPDGTGELIPIAKPMTRDNVSEALRTKAAAEDIYGLVHISEGWAYFPRTPRDHTMKQIMCGEMRVSDLNDQDKKEVLVVAMLSRDGESISWIDEIIRGTDAGISLGRALMLKDRKFTLGNVFQSP